MGRTTEVAASTSPVEQTHPEHVPPHQWWKDRQNTASGGSFLGRYLNTWASETWSYHACTAQCSSATPEENSAVQWDKPRSPGAFNLEKSHELEASCVVTTIILTEFISRASQAPTLLSAPFNYVLKGAPRLMPSLCNVSCNGFLTLVVTVSIFQTSPR